MGWHKRGSRKYYFRSVRDGKIVRKTYYGSGPVAELAAKQDRLDQFQKHEGRVDWNRQKEILLDAIEAFAELDHGAELLTAAVLLTSGFHHPPGRSTWRKSRHGQRVLPQPH